MTSFDSPILGMKTVSSEVDKKLQDANKYADEKRGELVQVSWSNTLFYNVTDSSHTILERQWRSYESTGNGCFHGYQSVG